MTLDLPTKEDLREVVREELRAALAGFHPAAELKPLDLLDVGGVAALCPGVTLATVRGWCRSGKLVAKRVGRGYLIERGALYRFLSVIQPVADDEPKEETRRILARLRGER